MRHVCVSYPTWSIGSAVGGNSRHRPSPPAAGVHWKRNAWARAACPSWATKRESTMKTWHDVKPTPKRRKIKKIKAKKDKSLENVVGFFLFLTANPMVEPKRKKDGDHYGINPTTISDCLYYLSTPPKETLHCISVTF